MQTNFFRQLAKLNLKGDLQMILRESTDNSFVLSVLLNNEQCGDETRKIIPLLISEEQHVCMGTVETRIKNSASLEEFIENWENCFFNSYFSHLMLNHRKRIWNTQINRLDQ
ncbi:hypothetical protein ASG22_06705 [Chryseobacterium sp. Leaf405]|uniref:hypothetical protein n=1 Tax=Chryseobacterium sp. Leaf405 TaxID=1736367 RepID=UPI0006FF2063|nr:hypothetical protein [Chryseobacterium sp. Leaf405]KQT23726.1 hypothetical protein ASG22_06705 [Chryseobacterium sp. Leaf405]